MLHQRLHLRSAQNARTFLNVKHAGLAVVSALLVFIVGLALLRSLLWSSTEDRTITGQHLTCINLKAPSVNDFFKTVKCEGCSGADAGVTWTIPRASDFVTGEFRDIMAKVVESPAFHRKRWEFYIIYKTLTDLGVVGPGKRGLGFGVGKEPLPSAFAALGAEIVATDMDPAGAQSAGWASTDQFAVNGLDDLYIPLLLDEDQFRRLVTYRQMDMNRIPEELHGTFDFVWSACAMEHVGSIEQSKSFLANNAKLLRPGGVAIHTTEFCLSNFTHHLTSGSTVMWTYDDVKEAHKQLKDAGFKVFPIDVAVGQDCLDQYVDSEPYILTFHLKLALAGLVSTSVSMVVQRPL